MILCDGRYDRGLFSKIDGTGGHFAHRVHHVGIGADARQRLFDTFESTHSHLELAANAGIATDRTGSQLRHAGIGRRQRDRTTGGQTLHQHAPTLACHLRATDDVVKRHENILAARRAIHEHGVEREVATAHVGSRGVAGNQRTGDADVLLATEQAIRVIEVEGQTEDGADRAKRDVTLVPSNTHAEDFLALPHALADDADVRNRCGVGPCPWAGQRKGGNLDTLGQTRQVVVFLLVSTVVQQQLCRAKRVRHHHRHRQGRRTRRQLGHHLRVRVGRELQAAVLLRDDHAEESVVLDILPGLRRHVLRFVRDLPVIDETASFFNLVVHEGLLGSSELGDRIGQHLVPVGIAPEQFAIPPHRTGLERFSLSVGHLRQDLLVGSKNRPADQCTPYRPDTNQHGNCDRYHGQQRDDHVDHNLFSFMDLGRFA